MNTTDLIKKILEEGTITFQRWLREINEAGSDKILGAVTNLFTTFADDAKEKAIELQSAEMRTLFLIALPEDFTEKDELLANYTNLGISIPRIWRSEEKKLRTERRSYLKIFIRYEPSGECSFVYEYSFFAGAATVAPKVVIMKEKVSNATMEYTHIIKKIVDLEMA